jgi:hypothetical protein
MSAALLRRSRSRSALGRLTCGSGRDAWLILRSDEYLGRVCGWVVGYRVEPSALSVPIACRPFSDRRTREKPLTGYLGSARRYACGAACHEVDRAGGRRRATPLPVDQDRLRTCTTPGFCRTRRDRCPTYARSVHATGATVKPAARLPPASADRRRAAWPRNSPCERWSEASMAREVRAARIQTASRRPDTVGEPAGAAGPCARRVAALHSRQRAPRRCIAGSSLAPGERPPPGQPLDRPHSTLGRTACAGT